MMPIPNTHTLFTSNKKAQIIAEYSVFLAVIAVVLVVALGVDGPMHRALKGVFERLIHGMDTSFEHLTIFGSF